MTPQLTDIVCYPLKGFPGHGLARADLAAGQGVAHDRRFAIEIGSSQALASETWAPCQHFTRLTIDPTLVRYGVRYDHAARRLSLRTPAHDDWSVQLDSAADRQRFDLQLAQQFGAGPQRPARLREFAGGAYWDEADAPISIVNAATIAALAATAGEPLAHARFRANLVIDGVPAWDELGWVGRTIDIGGVTLLVTAPIERCAATSVDPATGISGNAIPALLHSRFGHPYCGVYARVLHGATLAPGAPVRAPQRWRRLLVQEVREEGGATRSLILASADGAPLPPFVPGQHLTVRVAGTADSAAPGAGPRQAAEGGAERSYTLSGTASKVQTSYRISVKKKGTLSRALHLADVGTALDVSAPRGGFIMRPSPRTPVLVAGGIGITPMLAMLQQQAERDPGRVLWLLYGTRSWTDFPFRDELGALATRLPNLRIVVFFSRGMPAEPIAPFGKRLGRLSIDGLRAVLPFDAYDFYLCGTAGMLRNVSEGLLRLGIPRQQIALERFGLEAEAPQEAAFPAAASIRFTRSARSGLWREPAQTLLDFSEQLGIAAPWDCRAGSCGACRCTVRGPVHYAMQPMFSLGQDEALLCCARPLADLEIDL